MTQKIGLDPASARPCPIYCEQYRLIAVNILVIDEVEQECYKERRRKPCQND